MNILAPLNSIQDIEILAQAGVDEFYFGFYDNGWVEKFGKYSDINRMSGFGERANKFSLIDIEKVVDSIKDKQKKAYITINANEYSDEEIGYLEIFFQQLKKYDVDGVIVSTPLTCKLAVECGLSPVASTMCNIYNSLIADYYYRIGVRRMILPRELNLDEVEAIVNRYPDVDFELFMMRNGCRFSDSNCLGTHITGTGAMCRCVESEPYKLVSDNKDFVSLMEFDDVHHKYGKDFQHISCGMCALYRMNQLGIKALKVVGRADGVTGICRDVERIRDNIAIVKDSTSEKEYLERMEIPFEYKYVCKNGWSCYYPEVRFK